MGQEQSRKQPNTWLLGGSLHLPFVAWEQQHLVTILSWGESGRAGTDLGPVLNLMRTQLDSTAVWPHSHHFFLFLRISRLLHEISTNGVTLCALTAKEKKKPNKLEREKQHLREGGGELTRKCILSLLQELAVLSLSSLPPRTLRGLFLTGLYCHSCAIRPGFLFWGKIKQFKDGRG